MRPVLTPILTAAALCVAAVSFAQEVSEADVVILGEVHDNPTHHATQLEWIGQAKPKAVVYEMLLPTEAEVLNGSVRTAQAMKTAAQGFHWSNIADYADLLAASPVIIGAALPRDQVREAFSEGAAAVFGAEAEAYGLAAPLPADQLSTRMDHQFEAHCKAMPRDMMGGMVEAQRLRDAGFARVVVAALDKHGGPVVLITGNGHARKDWGVPAMLALVRPDVTVFSLGQGEAGTRPTGLFDQTTDAPRPDRGDPCDAFK